MNCRRITKWQYRKLVVIAFWHRVTFYVFY